VNNDEVKRVRNSIKLNGFHAHSLRNGSDHDGSALLGDRIAEVLLIFLDTGSASSLAVEAVLDSVDKALAHLAVDTMVDSIEDVVDSNTRLVGGLGSVLIHASLDEDAVPVVGSLLVDSIGTADVALRGVSNKIDSLGGSNKSMLGVAPVAHEAGSELKSRNLGLAESVSVELALALSQVAEGDLEHAAQSTHAQTDVLMSGRPHNIIVGEVEGGALVEGSAARADASTLRHGNVEHDLNVTSPVARVGKDEDGINDDVAKVAVTTGSVLLRSELAERGSGRVVLDDVARSNNISEPVALSNLAALLALTTHDEDGLVLLSHLAHGGVAADKLAGLDITLELAGKVPTALFLGLAAAVGKENVRPENGVS
jgi:hypothetical protein